MLIHDSVLVVSYQSNLACFIQYFSEQSVIDETGEKPLAGVIPPVLAPKHKVPLEGRGTV